MKENEIRPDKLMEEQQARYLADVERLLARRAEFVDVACPACGGRRRELAWQKYTLSYQRCSDCETVYTSPRPSSKVLADWYSASENYAYWNKYIFPASEGVRREKIFKPRVERVLSICRANGVERGTLLEVGAGFGIFCEEIAKRGFSRVVALEPTPDLAATCRRRGLEVIESRAEDVDPSTLRCDVVVSFEVIEHLFEPNDFARRCHALLAPGGLLIITCPNVKGFDIALLAEKSGAVDTEHLNYFHPRSLGLLLDRCGFDVIETSTPGQLDVDLVHKQVAAGGLDVSHDAFLKRVLVDEYDRLGPPFQAFLAEHGLSSHMWVVARRRG
jgi:2-polyprenyl-3-methyl-5-hydroxy-6-metoxy-1,4-benzoquinol methylase